MMLLGSVLALLVVGCCVPSVLGETYYVNPTAQQEGTGTKSDPFNTIAKAVQAAQFGGDRIALWEGTYTGDGNHGFILNNEIDFVPMNPGAARPIVDLTGGSFFAIWEPKDNASAIVATVSNIIFRNSEGSGSAASVFEIRSGSVSFVNCDFLANKGQDVGAVLLSGSTENKATAVETMVSFLNCNFAKNSAISGPAVTMFYHPRRGVIFMGCNFTQNTATGPGGAIYSDAASFAIAGSYFTQNTAKGASNAYGGAIFAQVKTGEDTPILSISGSVFDSNSAINHGGAIAVFNGGTLALESVTFLSNQVSEFSAEDLQYGGAVHIAGVLLAESCVFENNLCSAYASGRGGGLSIDEDGGANFIRNTLFKSNGCRYGSDVAVSSGTAFFHESNFSISTDPFQLYVAGISRFEDCRFSEKSGEHLHSLILVGDGLASFDFTNLAPLAIDTLTLRDSGRLLTSGDLSVNTMTISGGTIEASTTAHIRKFTLTGTAAMSAKDVVIAGFQFNNQGTLTVQNGVTVRVTDLFTNSKTMYLEDHATFAATIDGFPVAFDNFGQIYTNSTATFFCNFHNHPGALFVLANTGTHNTPVIIAFGAWLSGNLNVQFSTEGEKSFKKGQEMTLFKYDSLEQQPFQNVSLFPSFPATLAYGSGVLTIKKSGGGDLSGGDVAGIVIAVAIALGAFTFASWYFIIRPQDAEAPGQAGPGYGAV